MSEQIQQMQELLQKSLIKINSLEAALEKNKGQQTKKHDPIAIVGCGVRLPGKINNTKKLWNLLIEKKSVAKEIPAERFNVNSIFSENPETPGKMNVRYGAFLENDVRAFDASFFNISPREAKSMDPLQRMILEVVYEAFENAGIATDSLKGSKTGVYIALGNSDYIQARLRNGNLESIDLYDATGIPFGTAGGRVSYLYDFKGPSYNVDAACASAILAIHLAKQDLQNNEIDLAVVSSANLLLTPEIFIGLSRLGSLTSTNQCKAFSNDADGYIRGEGCGVVIMKRLSDAEKDNDNIELIIKSSSVKHNGKSNGFTAPNPEIQIATIKAALSEAALSVDDIDYIEAHGIGNKVTDAVEVQSINDGYKGRQRPLYIGSVKANIGHLEASTGMPMLFKIIEIIKHKKIPAQINITTLNQDVEWNKINAIVSTETIDWKNKDDKPLRAAINLSGYSGTNVHMIFEEPAAKNKSDAINTPFHFILSAKDAIALKNTAQKYLHENEWMDSSLTEICYTLQTGRNHLEYSVSILASDKQDIIDGLTDFVKGEVSEKYIISNPEMERNKEVAFLFTGQGAQYFGMCKDYYDTFALFKNTIDACDDIIKPNLGQSIKDILWNDTIDKNLIYQTKFTQPALFVVEYALSKLWMSFGVRPSALIGHSIGEIVALTVANAIDLQDALKLVIARAALMNSLPLNEGTMASVFCNEENIRELLQHSTVDLAAVNSVKNCTVSGKKEDVAAFIEKLREHKIKAVTLNVSHAFHSRLMEPITERFIAFAKQFSFQQPEIPVISNLSGKEITKQELSAEYFANHIRNAVQFSKGIAYLQNELPVDIYLEVGPNPVLISLAKQTNINVTALWLPSAKKDESDVQHFHKTLQHLYVAGTRIDWRQFYQHKKINRVLLPTYGWNHKVYWENPVRQSIVDSQSLAGRQIGVSNDIKSDLVTSNYRPSTIDQKSKATRETLLAYMQIEAAKVLGLEAGQKVDINKPYREQGFDSMMSGEFLSLMEKHIGSELKMDFIHLYNTPKDLHRFLIDTYYGGGDIDTSQAITMADIMFNQEMEHTHAGDWHEIKPEDGKLLRWFKKIDRKIPQVK